MNKIISFIMVGVKDLEKSSKFYDAIFVPLGIIKASTTEKHIGYAQKNNPNEIIEGLSGCGAYGFVYLPLFSI